MAPCIERCLEQCVSLRRLSIQTSSNLSPVFCKALLRGAMTCNNLQDLELLGINFGELHITYMHVGYTMYKLCMYVHYTHVGLYTLHACWVGTYCMYVGYVHTTCMLGYAECLCMHHTCRSVFAHLFHFLQQETLTSITDVRTCI